MAAEQGLYDLKPLQDLSHALETSRDGRIGARVQVFAKSLKQSALVLKHGGEPRSRENVPAEVFVVVHKIKTQLTAFVNNKAGPKQVTAIILIKAAVESGGVKAFQEVLPIWVKGLFSILKVCIETWSIHV